MAFSCTETNVGFPSRIASTSNASGFEPGVSEASTISTDAMRDE